MATANGGRTGIFYDVRTKKNRSACMAQTRAHITHENVNKYRKQKSKKKPFPFILHFGWLVCVWASV